MVKRLVSADSETGQLPDKVVANLDSRAAAALATQRSQEAMLGKSALARSAANAFLLQAPSRAAQILLIGDSNTEGRGQTAFENRISRLLQTALNGIYSPGVTTGRGFLAPALADPTPSFPYTNIVQCSSNVTFNQDAGPNKYAAYVPNGSTITYNLDAATTADIYFTYVTETAAKFTYTSTGYANPVEVNAGGGINGGGVVRANLGESGAKTLIIKATGGSGVFINGIKEWNTNESGAGRGVMVHALGHFGFGTANFNGNTWRQSVAALGGDILAINLMTNDPQISLTPAQTASNLAAIINDVRVASGKPTMPVLVVIPPAPSGQESTWAARASAVYALEADPLVAIVDLSARVPAAATDASLGLGNFVDQAHYSNQGARLIANVLATALRTGIR